MLFIYINNFQNKILIIKEVVGICVCLLSRKSKNLKLNSHFLK